MLAFIQNAECQIIVDLGWVYVVQITTHPAKACVSVSSLKVVSNLT